MPAGQLQRAGAVRRRVALLDLGHVEHAVGGEVATADQVEHVPADGVRAGHPAGADDHPGIGQVADAGGVVGAEHAGTDVALGQARVVGEVLLGERLGLVGLELRGQPLQVDLAVAGHGDGQRLAGAVHLAHHHQHVLQRVRRRSTAGRRAGTWALAWSTRVWMVGVSGVSCDVRGRARPRTAAGRARPRARPRRWRRSHRRRRRRCPHRSPRRPGTPRWPSHPWPRRWRAR